MRFSIPCLLGFLIGASALGGTPLTEPILKVGSHQLDITPKVEDPSPVWLAGFGPGRQASGVHDRLFVRALVIDDGTSCVALLTLDLVGLFRDEVQKIRQALPEIDHLTLTSTHNHEGPDTLGLWGESLTQSGVDPDYLERVREACVAAVQEALQRRVPVIARYGERDAPELLSDSRRPYVKDATLRTLLFCQADSDQREQFLLLQWNCHPETLGSRNTEITADFPHATIAALEETYDCPVAYFTGPVGGLMSAPDYLLHDEQGRPLREGSFAFADAYGRAVAEVARQAITESKPIDLTPIRHASQTVLLPMDNPYYKLAFTLGVVDRPVYRYDPAHPDTRGERITTRIFTGPSAIETEVSLVRFGELTLCNLPGEIYPELVVGGVPDPAEQDVDFPDAPVESTLLEILPPGPKLIFNLANDEVGYIIPRRQWDEQKPFAYGRRKAPYGEINSIGPEVAPRLVDAVQRCIQELNQDM